MMLGRAFLGGEREQRAWRIALLLATLLGLGLRLANYVIRPPTLWQDEAYWAVRALKMEAINAQIRPLGFMLITQALLRVFGAAAWVYRILPFLGSIVSMLLMPYVALRLFRTAWAQLLAVVLLAISPVALEMAVEFKHYGTEVGVYVAVLAALLHYFERRTLGSFLLVLGAAWALFFLSLTVIFTYPAIFGWLAWDAWKTRRFRWLMGAAGTALICLATITTIYFTTWRTISSGKAENKWGTWYDVFYIKNGLKTTHDSRLTWTAAKYFELASVPGVGRERWESSRISPEGMTRLREADLVLWGALHVLGLAWLARKKRFGELAVLWSPLLILTAFNLAGRWPAGAFRTNTFYVPFAILIASFATEWFLELREGKMLRWLGPSFAACLLLPTLWFRPALTEKGLWAKPGAFTEAMLLLPEAPPRGERKLLMDFESCRPWEYYANYDKAFLKRRPEMHRTYSVTCLRTGMKLAREMKKLASSQPRGFSMLFTDPRKFDYLVAAVQETCAESTTHWVRGRTHLLFRCQGAK